jgi:peptidoglycan glycosyltransferase
VTAPAAAGAPRIAATLLSVGLAIIVAYGALGAGLTYWQVIQADSLTEDPANPLVLAAARRAPRGAILDRNGTVLADNVAAADGSRIRRYASVAAAPIIGYRSFRFGASGLERTYDAELIGLGQLDPVDRLLRKFRPDPYDPQDLVLTIDARLQQRAFELLGRDRGAVVAIEPATGRILALASTPTYDPNRIVDPEGGDAYFEELRRQPSASSALVDRATQGRYTAGSIFKIVTALAGLGSGAITAETRYEDQPGEEKDGFVVDGFPIRDGHHPFTDDEALDLLQAIEVSCNIYFAHVGLDTGGADLSEWAGRMGFGSPIPFDLPTEPSLIDGGDGFEGDVELASAAFGQGETFVTPFQMALVAATVANRGELMRPEIVETLRARSGRVRTIDPQPWQRVVSGTTAGIVAQAMRDAVEGEWGHLFAGGAKIPGVPTAGKSGTAELGGQGEPHSWFIGFAPADQPRIAIAILVEQGGRGAERAVPMGGDLMGTYLALGD